MRPTESRRHDVHRERPEEGQGQRTSPQHLELPSMSVTDKGAFMEVLELQYGDPILHSTALEDDLDKSEDKGGPKDGDRPVPRRKPTEGIASKSDKGTAELEKKSPAHLSSRPVQTASRRLVGKKPGEKRTAGQTSRPADNQRSNPALTNGSGSQSLKKLDSASRKQRHCTHLSSDEGDGEDNSWKPSPKKSRPSGSGRMKKTSSGETSSEKENEVQAGKRRRPAAAHRDTESDVVLQAFQEFCTKYRESVESKEVQESIDVWCQNVSDQIMEKVSASKELRALKRANAKMGSVVRCKIQRMLDVKHELMKAERDVQQLQKEHSELTDRLTDLRRGQAFLGDLRELTGRYLQHRREQPDLRETYGASSLPVLLWEARNTKAAEPQSGEGLKHSAKKRKATKRKGL